MIRFITDTTIHIDDFSIAKHALESIKNDSMSGWLNVPSDTNELAQIYQAANKIKNDSKYLIKILQPESDKLEHLRTDPVRVHRP